MIAVFIAAWFSVSLSAQIQDPAGESVTDQSAGQTEISPDPARPDETLLLLDDTPAEGPAAEGGTSSFMAVLRMILVLALVAVAIYGIVYLLKKINKTPTQQDGRIKILASTHLGSNRYVHVISLADKAYLVGSAEGGVSLIAEIEDKETVDTMLLDESRKNAEAGAARFLDFKSIFRRLTGGTGVSQEELPSSDTIKKRRERFKGL
ncbi:flagellar biosynthetic protein FliO [Breznakiella homolactica]|uniref:Flagellar protein n=1 Tax=Breznakiella homolactica TaxID=2798577 RepID=A0A7T7XL31_9SPIR|nr:flagellar biosynthetic protein FliO [Breznakiella homolactica]QQO08247.1 flagellar biosynthetic protein FliO [Breznakiella homolactica]